MPSSGPCVCVKREKRSKEGGEETHHLSKANLCCWGMSFGYQSNRCCSWQQEPSSCVSTPTKNEHVIIPNLHPPPALHTPRGALWPQKGPRLLCSGHFLESNCTGNGSTIPFGGKDGGVNEGADPANNKLREQTSGPPTISPACYA